MNESMERATWSLTGRKILVTGASRGIGAAIALELATRGASVAVGYATREDAAQSVLKTLPGSGHFTVKIDVSSEESIDQAFSQVVAKWETFDGLVNNAGITKDNLLLRMKTEDFDQVIQTNLRGTYILTRNALKMFLKAKKPAAIVNITSISGQTGNAGQANYAASKAGMEAFSRSAAMEVASRGIRVNCVAPGFIATEMTEVLKEDQKKMILEKIPLGRMAEAKEVATAVAFLLSDDARYITGHTLSVNGGMYMN